MIFFNYQLIYEPLAYRRFIWDTGENYPGDIERILGETGNSIVTEDEDGHHLWPVLVDVNTAEPYKPILLDPMGAPVKANGLYKWSDLITVAPSATILATLQATLKALDEMQINEPFLARGRRFVKTNDRTKNSVLEIVNGTYTGGMPVVQISDDTLTSDDIVEVGDGNLHGQEIDELHLVALARACQALGVNLDAVIKKERLITNETEQTDEMVNIIRQNEIEQRQKIADMTGWTFRTVI